MSRIRTVGRLLLLPALALVLAGPAAAVTHVVNSTDDDPDINIGDGVCYTGQLVFFGGPFGTNECTLRAAIQESQAQGQFDEIIFTGLIPLDAFGTLQFSPSTPYPDITTWTRIDGRTVPEWDEMDPWAYPIVYINGVNAASGSGLRFSGSGANSSQVLAIGFINWPSYGVHVSGLTEFEIEASHIGVYKGTLAQGNGSHGLYISSGSYAGIGDRCNTFSGCGPGQGNVISGNGGWGIRMFGSYHQVSGNRIGTNSAGTADMGNGLGGVYVGSNDNTIGGLGTIAVPSPPTDVASGNLISGNDGPGIRLLSASNVVYANYIGTDATGSSSIPNAEDGVLVEDGWNTIGEVGLGANVISGNVDSGVRVEDAAADGVIFVEGNAIGVDATRSAPLGNGAWGIYVGESEQVEIRDNVVGDSGMTGINLTSAVPLNILTGNYVGTNASGTDLGNALGGIVVSSDQNYLGAVSEPPNVVGHNGGSGIYLNGAGNKLINSNIGTDASGADLGNDQWGILVAGSDNTVGGDVSLVQPDLDNRSNRIAWNGSSGIGLDSIVKRTGLRGNVFHDNGEIAIDLDLDGATPNDADDVDTGANKLQNTPEIDTDQTDWNVGTGQIDIRYRVDSHVTQVTYPLVVDFNVTDATGPGQVWVGSDTIPFAEAGLWRDISITPPGGVAIIGEYLSAMATDSDSSGNSSELSATHLLPEPGVGSSLFAGVSLLAALSGARRRRR